MGIFVSFPFVRSWLELCFLMQLLVVHYSQACFRLYKYINIRNIIKSSKGRCGTFPPIVLLYLEPPPFPILRRSHRSVSQVLGQGLAYQSGSILQIPIVVFISLFPVAKISAESLFTKLKLFRMWQFNRGIVIYIFLHEDDGHALQMQITQYSPCIIKLSRGERIGIPFY